MEITDFNPWWETGAIDRETSSMKKRDLFPKLKESLEERFIEIEDWENKVKVLYDLNPGVKLILSGSASLNLISFTRFGTA
jgi:hypothetical protein